MSATPAPAAPTGPVHVGKPRTLGGGRTWRVRAYAGARPRVTFLDPDTGWTRGMRYPSTAEARDLADLFARVEAQMDMIEAGTAGRTIREVCRRLLLAWEASTLEGDTVDNRRSLIRKWVCTAVPGPDRTTFLLGDVSVHQGWTTKLSGDFLRAVADTGELGSARLEDLRTLLASVRDAAHDLGWLALDVDPLRKVKLPRLHDRATQQNTGRSYVPTGMRPSTAAVETLLRLARDRRNCQARSIDPVQLEVGAYMGFRLSEQLGTAVEDLAINEVREPGEPVGLEIVVSGAWISPRDGEPRYRPWTKNRKWREVFAPDHTAASLLQNARVALGLDADVPEHVLIAAVAARRQAFAQWYDLPARVRDEVPMPTRHYLFLDPKFGVPWEQERFNDLFRELRRATIELAAEDSSATAWPEHIPYRNARHHSAMWWRRTLPEAQDEEWTLVAKLLGNSPETCRRQYVVLGAGSYEEARKRLRGVRLR